MTVCRTPTECDIFLKVNTICLFVWLDTDNFRGYFSDNGFIMTQPTKVVQFYSEDELTADQLQKSLSVLVLDKRRLGQFSFAQNAASVVQIMVGDSKKNGNVTDVIN